MSQMLTNIRRVVKGVSNRTTQWDVLFEAITNSVHANATHIVCRLIGDQAVLMTANGDELAPKKVIAMEIEDDGDGFDDPNYKSFGNYGTDYNIDLGCKGVGRFVYLKIFENVRYTSLLAAMKKKREFVFSFDFESDDIQEEDAEVSNNKTILNLSGVTDKIFSKDRNVDRRLDLRLQDIKKKVLLHLIPTLFFHKRNGRNIVIELIDQLSGESLSIDEKDVPDFTTKSFEILGSNQKKIKFSLHHSISAISSEMNAFYCADGRTVCTFSDKGFKPRGFSGYLLLESEYFNGRVNNERNDFGIYPVRTDMFETLSWEMINRSLKAIITTLVYDEIPEVDEKNKKQLREIQEERPYLVQYIEEEDIKIAGFIGKKQIVEKAKKRFDEAKESLLANTGKVEYSEKELEDAIQIAQNELVAYIHDRVLVVQRLKTMLNDKEQSEAVIHNLFMERYTEDVEYNFFSTKKNNLWLLDDRFTSYSYAASEKRIRDILKQSGSIIDDDRPDLALFFSQDPCDKKGLKSVIVELKSFKDHSKSDRDKFAGIQQLIDYIKAFKSKEEIEEVWAFLVTDVDRKLEDRLIDNNYLPLFSTQTPIFHQYFPKMKMSIYVVGAQSLILDAEARNKVFIDIVNKQSRLNKYLDTP